MHVSKNNMILGAVAGVVLLGASFWGGMAYAKSGSPARGSFTQFGAAGGNAQFAGRTGAAGTRGAAAGGFTAGQILSQDANGITIKMADGSTKIILVGASTQIAKQAAGSASDLVVGANVTITGSANSDGSITASSIQLRPAGTAPATVRVQTQ